MNRLSRDLMKAGIQAFEISNEFVSLH